MITDPGLCPPPEYRPYTIFLSFHLVYVPAMLISVFHIYTAFILHLAITSRITLATLNFLLCSHVESEYIVITISRH